MGSCRIELITNLRIIHIISTRCDAPTNEYMQKLDQRKMTNELHA